MDVTVTVKSFQFISCESDKVEISTFSFVLSDNFRSEERLLCLVKAEVPFCLEETVPMDMKD